LKISTGIIVVVGVFLTAVMLGIVVIVVTGRDPSAYVFSVGSILTSFAGFVAALAALRGQNKKIDTIKQNTNGTLSRLLNEYEKAIARAEYLATNVDPATIAQIHDDTLNADEIAALRERIKP